MRRAKNALAGIISILIVGLPVIGFAAPVPPSISYTANGTTPFSTLSVSGNGFGAGETVQVFLGLSKTETVADGAGNFSGVPLTIPSVPSGLYIIIAVGQSSGLVAFTNIFVSAFFPAAAPSSWYIAPGSTLTWSGSGFVPGEAITVTNDAAGATIASFNADGSGGFQGAGASTIPYAARNSSLSLSLHGAQSGVTLPVAIGVSDLFPTVLPSTWYAVPGSPVSFSGAGFGPGEGIDVYLGAGTNSLLHFVADASGSFTGQGPLALPFGTTAEYRLVGDQSGVSAVIPVTLAAFYPQLTPSAYYGAPGMPIAIEGSGFAGGESVSLTMNGAPVGTTTATAAGTFAPLLVTLPITPNTPALIHAEGSQSGAASDAAVMVGQFYPDVTPSSWYVFPGDTVTFAASGFGPNEMVHLTGSVTGSAVTDATGHFAGLGAVIPLGASGVANFTFTGAESGATQSIGITLGTRATFIWFDTYYAQGGTPLTVFGSGFGSGESVALAANGVAFSTATADATGNLAAHTAIPFAPSGSLEITATGGGTGATASAALTVAPAYPDFQLASYAVPAGSAVTFVGHGYLPNDPLTITTDRTGSTAVANFGADATGSFNYSSFLIPADWMDGALTVTATSGHSFTSTPITLWVIGQ